MKKEPAGVNRRLLPPHDAVIKEETEERRNKEDPSDLAVSFFGLLRFIHRMGSIQMSGNVTTL